MHYNKNATKLDSRSREQYNKNVGQTECVCELVNLGFVEEGILTTVMHRLEKKPSLFPKLYSVRLLNVQ